METMLFQGADLSDRLSKLTIPPERAARGNCADIGRFTVTRFIGFVVGTAAVASQLSGRINAGENDLPIGESK